VDDGQYIEMPARPPGRALQPYLQAAYDLSTPRVPPEGGEPPGFVKEPCDRSRSGSSALDEIAALTKFVFLPTGESEYDEKARRQASEGRRREGPSRRSGAGLAALERFAKEPVKSCMKSVRKKTRGEAGKGAQPLRVAVTGSDQSPPMHDTSASSDRERVDLPDSIRPEDSSGSNVLVVGSVASTRSRTPHGGGQRASGVGDALRVISQRFGRLRLVGVVGKGFPAPPQALEDDTWSQKIDPSASRQADGQDRYAGTGRFEGEHTGARATDTSLQSTWSWVYYVKRSSPDTNG